MTDCIFCKIVRKELPAETVMETDDFIAFNDISPAAPTHILVVPKKHIPTLNDLGEGDEALLASMAGAAIRLAGDQGVAESGYRLVINCNKEGGQEVYHLHLHLLGGKPLGGMTSR
ncbi:MAG: histidine triad nucleotide-binding protein [Planctomycetota bacterium]|jgi:histidine triad (HIT) family protein